MALRRFLFQSPKCTNCLARTYTYKSIYNVDNLYPESVGAFSSYPTSDPPSIDPDDPQKFTGSIPQKKIRFLFSKSSKPGGQHVNKTLTKVEARFHVMSAEWLPQHVRQLVYEKYRRKITRDGELIVWNEESRYQLQNVKGCLDEIRRIIDDAQKPADRSKELRLAELNDMESIKAAQKKRLQKKRVDSYTKSMRTDIG